MPMQWDSETEQLRNVNVYSRQFILYYFNVFFVYGFIETVSTIHIFWNATAVDVTMLVLTFTSILFALWFNLVCFSCIKHWDEHVEGLKYYNQLIRILRIQTLEVARVFSKSEAWKRRVVFLSSQLTTFRYIPIIIVLGRVFIDMDPAGYSLKKIFCSVDSSQCAAPVSGILLVIRIILLGIGIAELARFNAFALCLFMYYFERLHFALLMISQTPMSKSELYAVTRLKWYKYLTVADRVNNSGWCSLIGTFCGGGFAAWVTLNVITVRCFGIIWIVFYLNMPVLAVVMGVVISLILSAIVNSAETSAQILYKLNLELPNVAISNGKAARKIVQSVRPLQLTCGPFYAIVGDSKVAYVYDVFLRTVDGIMLPIFEN